MSTTENLNAIERQRRMFGCTREELREGVESSITFKLVGWPMLAAGMMSDAQELFERGALEQARQTLNCAKWVLFEYGPPPR